MKKVGQSRISILNWLEIFGACCFHVVLDEYYLDKCLFQSTDDMTIEILLDIIILVFLALSLLLCIGLLLIVFIYYRPFTSKVVILLIFNTYFTLSLTCISMFIIYIYNLYGDINPLISVKDNWCQLRAYFVNVCFCALYYSCVLQSIFRLVRVVFYKLQSSQVFLNAIILKWLLSFILILSNFLNGDYQYLPFQYRCWISFQNTRGLLLAASIIYVCPLCTILFIYIYIVRHVRQTRQLQQRRQMTIQRDLLVLKRITILVLVITLIGLPTISILFICMISGKLIPMAYHIQGLSMSIGLFIATICFAFITPQIQEMFNPKQRCISPPLIRECYQHANTEPIQLETDDLS
jgi:hypothetical protein